MLRAIIGRVECIRNCQFSWFLFLSEGSPSQMIGNRVLGFYDNQPDRPINQLIAGVGLLYNDRERDLS